MNSSLTTRLSGVLAGRQLPDGSVRGTESDPIRADATAWAALAWSLVGEGERARAAATALMSAQGHDGRVSAAPQHPGSSWPTPIAALAWRALSGYESSWRRAVDYLLGESGERMAREAGGPVAIDPSIGGWPWVERTFSWVAPTAQALLALAACGEGGHARADEGRRMLLDRQLPSGGWNYGNTLVFGAELLSAPEETALALAALAGRVERATVERSLALLRTEAARVRTPLTLGWAVLALAAWNERPGDADARLEESLARAERYGGYDTADLALLAIATAAPGGLAAALDRTPG